MNPQGRGDVCNLSHYSRISIIVCSCCLY